MLVRLTIIALEFLAWHVRAMHWETCAGRLSCLAVQLLSLGIPTRPQAQRKYPFSSVALPLCPSVSKLHRALRHCTWPRICVDQLLASTQSSFQTKQLLHSFMTRRRREWWLHDYLGTMPCLMRWERRSVLLRWIDRFLRGISEVPLPAFLRSSNQKSQLFM